MVKLIKSKQLLYSVSADDLAFECDIAKSTFYYHMRNPDRFTLKELRAISKKLHIPITDLVITNDE